MTDLFVTYGPDAVTWVLAALGFVGTLVLAQFGWSSRVREILQRAWTEVQGAVREVSQTYVDELRKAKQDGVLTDEEKLHAKQMAIKIAKDNLGSKGLARLARVVGIDIDQWLSSKTEQALSVIKDQPKTVVNVSPPSPT